MPMPYAIGKAHHQSPCEFAEILKYLSVGLSRLSLFAHCKGSHTLNTKVLKDVQVVQNISS